jgi:hypothetical protein
MRSQLALGGISVQWDKIFHMKASSHLTGMDIFDLIIQCSIERYGWKIQTKIISNYSPKAR